MRRRSSLLVAGILLVSVAISVGGALLFVPIVDSIRSQPAPVEVLLTLNDLPPGFAQVDDTTMNLGFETVALRRFQLRADAFVQGPFLIENTAIRSHVPMSGQTDTAIDAYLKTLRAADAEHASPEPIDGPFLGAPTAWRIQQGTETDEPTDWLVVGIQQGTSLGVVRVLGYRGEVAVDDVVPLGLRMAERMGARPIDRGDAGPTITVSPPESPSARSSRPAGGRGVYFIPLGDLREPDIKALASWYQDRYQIPIEVLDALPLGPTEIDARRHQAIAEALTDLIQRSYPELAAESDAVLIGITPRYMYIRQRPDWQWAFANRVGRLTVISTFPMDPRAYREPPDANLLATRLRKMITKSIALQYYGMSLNSDRTSVLYDSILGLDDLDFVSEDPDPILTSSGP